ncbi:MAG: acyltransferase family protein [Lachnospiraceae bacterium]|nr:acyltransferase family protein [Lachnospiraceae bacterium]
MKQRKTGIELLRIFAMLLIVMHHYAQIGCEALMETNVVSGEKIYMQFFFLGGKLGQNLFILITGYFLCMSQRRWGKVLSLVVQVTTYSVLSMLIVAYCFGGSLNILTIVRHCFPLVFLIYPFATYYVLLYIFSPYLNAMIEGMGQKKHKELLLIGAVVWIVIPTLTSENVGMSDLIWYVYLYLVSAYIRKYPIEKEGWNRSGKWILLGIGMYGLTFLSVIVFDFIGLKIPAVGMKATYFVSQNKIPIFMTSVFLFMGFIRLELKANKLICKIASGTFGVFLIHMAPLLIPYLWNRVLKVPKYVGTNQIYIHALISVLMIFTVGVIVELIRQWVMSIIHKGIAMVATKKQE